MAAGHVDGDRGPVDEYETLRVQIGLAIEPFLALLQDIGAVLLDGAPMSGMTAKKRSSATL